MPPCFPCPFDGAAPGAPQHDARPASRAGGQLACNADGLLSSAVALVEAKVANAIAKASHSRKRAAVMLVHFAPRCDCDGNAPCWDLGLADLLARMQSRACEWGPLRLDATTLVMVVQDFDDSAHIQRRATEILTGIGSGWCPAGSDRMLECAIGIGLFPEDGETADKLLSRADEALCDLRAVGHNAAGFSLRRTVPGRSSTSDRARSAQRPWQRSGQPDGCGSASEAPRERAACV
jgi:hypothetical protein